MPSSPSTSIRCFPHLARLKLFIIYKMFQSRICFYTNLDSRSHIREDQDQIKFTVNKLVTSWNLTYTVSTVEAVLRIRDILVRILIRTFDIRVWIRFRRSCPFCQWLPRYLTKNKFFFLICFPYFFLLVHLRQSSKIIEKQQKLKHWNSRNQGFYFFACWWKAPDPYKMIMDPDPEGPKT